MNDPILVQRARLVRLARLGQRLGYLAYLVAIGVFAVGLTTGFTDAFAVTLVVLLVAGSFVLAPAIILHYAVRAAADEERTGVPDNSDG